MTLEKFTKRDFDEEDHAAVVAWRNELIALGHIYRYRSLAGEGFARIYDLVTRSDLFFPSYPELNDPFDGRVLPNADGTDAEKREHIVDFLTEDGRPLDTAAENTIRAFLALGPASQAERILKVHEEQMKQMGVACFSAAGDDIPMWAYYADSHRGVCLRFRGLLLTGLPECTPAIKVVYKDAYPDVSFFKATRFRRVVTLVDTKATAWSHEKEWRIVRTSGRGPAAFDPAALDGIILGCEIKPADERRLKDLCARVRPDLEVLKTSPAHRAFRLDMAPA